MDTILKRLKRSSHKCTWYSTPTVLEEVPRHTIIKRKNTRVPTTERDPVTSYEWTGSKGNPERSKSRVHHRVDLHHPFGTNNLSHFYPYTEVSFGPESVTVDPLLYRRSDKRLEWSLNGTQ